MTESIATRYETCVGCRHGIPVGQKFCTKKKEKFCSRRCMTNTTHNDKLTRTDRILRFMAQGQGGVREAIHAIR